METCPIETQIKEIDRGLLNSDGGIIRNAMDKTWKVKTGSCENCPNTSCQWFNLPIGSQTQTTFHERSPDPYSAPIQK
ncbi:hypothetical protein GF362_06980 [Candidatus Dojkabacteria bacterium]|nr:hypothetical protein [Candidatus Dojkabacteria bacterium]